MLGAIRKLDKKADAKLERSANSNVDQGEISLDGIKKRGYLAP